MATRRWPTTWSAPCALAKCPEGSRSPTAACCAPATRWTAPTRSRWTSRALAAGRPRLRGALHPHLQGHLRRDAAPLPAAPARRALDVPAARDRSQRHRHLPGRGLQQPGHVHAHVPRDRRRDAYRLPRATDAARARCPPASRWRGPDRAVSEKPVAPTRGSVVPMFNAITISAVFVLDQDEALDFYVGKLGLEVAQRRRPGLHALAHGARARASPSARSCWSCPARRRWTKRLPNRCASS